MKLAVAQIQVHLGKIEKNIETHLAFIEKAIAENADLILFPELSLTGYDIKTDAPLLALNREDTLLSPFLEASKKIGIIAGFIELAFAAQIYNAAIYFKDGKICRVHHKISLPNYSGLEEGKHFSAGRFLNLFPLSRDWQAGPLICNDFWNPGLVNLAAIKGATCFIVPANSAEGVVAYDSIRGWYDIVSHNAKIFGSPTVLVNRVGNDNDYKFWGGSAIFDARGDIVAQAPKYEQDMIMADLDYKDVVQARADLPTVRDSDLDLILREMERFKNQAGWHAEHWKSAPDQ